MKERIWVVVGPQGLYWVGLADDEKHAWTIAHGWPSDDDIQELIKSGWYAATANVTWRKP